MAPELTGSESRADVAPKDESVGMAKKLDDESMRRRAEKTVACLEVLAPKVSGSAVAAGFSAARLGGGFAATRPAEAEGDGDGWCATAITAAAPADTAGAAIFTGDADNVGASVGADGASGAVAAPEVGQTWADVGGFDLYPTCIVGGDQEMADREELADGGSKTTGAEETDTEVPISEVAPRPDPGRQYVGRAGGVLQVCDDGGGSRATTTEAGGGVDDARTGLGDADSDGASLAVEAEFGAALAGSESRADVDPRSTFALVAAMWMQQEDRKEMKARGELKARGDDPERRRKFWADVGRRDSDRLRTSADQQTMAPRGASEQVGKAKTSGRKADKVSIRLERRGRGGLARCGPTRACGGDGEG